MDPIIGKKSKLRNFNNLLSLVVIGLGIYIALVPVIPAIEFWWKQRSGVHIPYSGALANASTNGDKENKPIPNENRLVMPSISLNEEIKEGSSISVIDDGSVWRRPNTSVDPLIGNMVVVGHRFTYSNPSGSFYNLDKINVGDTLALYWSKKEYIYKVEQIKVVEASNTEIESPTTDNRLTLYTCTPIWSAKQRLVVIAKPLDLTDAEKN